MMPLGISTAPATLLAAAAAPAAAHRYTRTAIALHWLHAGLIVALVAIGWTMVDLPKGDARSAAFALHKSLGLTALLLIALRLAWRIGHEPPAQPADPLGILARTGHTLLYSLLVIVPLSGLLTSAATKFPLKFFGWTLPRLMAPDESLNILFKAVHRVSLQLLLLLLLVHVGAALWHGWRGDGLLARMRPRLSRN